MEEVGESLARGLMSAMMVIFTTGALHLCCSRELY